jgi:three-Cys-motif partner protein
MPTPREKVRALPPFENDGLDEYRESSPHVEQKLRRVWQYDRMFSRALRRKFEARVYIDLFAASGANEIRESSRIVPGTPLLAMMVDHPFDRYILCEVDGRRLAALTARVARLHPEISTPRYIAGDCNRRVREILDAIPQHRPSYRVVSLCLVDPEKTKDIEFDTIRALAGESRAMDFLFTIPTGMEVRRNFKQNYLRPGDDTLDRFLGGRGWRARVKEALEETNIPYFTAMELARSMQELGYLRIEERDLSPVQIESGPGKGVRLYHLTVLSRNPLALKLWRACLRAADRQTLLDL